MTSPEHHNWPKLIAELEAAGVSVYKIAVMVNRQFGQVKRWKHGVEPKHYEGDMLLAIHAEYVRLTPSGLLPSSVAHGPE